MVKNEVDRVVIEMPKGGDGWCDVPLIGVAFEGSGAAVLVEADLVASHRIIKSVCSKRATEVVGGGLLVGGKEVKPEKYLGLWRAAIEARVPVACALERFGLSICLVVRGNSAKQQGVKKHSTLDPMDGFDGWSEKYLGRMRVDADGYFELNLMATEEGAVQAWTFMRQYRDYKDEDVRGRSELKVLWNGGLRGVASEVAPMDSERQPALQG